MQWAIVAAYAFFVAVPAFLPLPADDAHWYNSLALAAQWLFWGIWWPSVILSMFVLGRTWCGLFCPEGVLTEAASRHGLGRAVPRWMKWGGWPFVAFALTTVFGQLVSVYQYPAATLLVLGGSTLAAIGVGFVYGRGKRVWCRHLCPVNGVFAVLSRVSPLHYRVDTDAWAANVARIPVHPVNCAPLVRIRRMTGPSECHMCGRCSGLHGAIALAARPPNREVATLDPANASGWDAALIVFGMIGLALGAFEWSALPSFVSLRSAAVSLIVDHGPAWLLADNAPWWLLTQLSRGARRLHVARRRADRRLDRLHGDPDRRVALSLAGARRATVAGVMARQRVYLVLCADSARRCGTRGRLERPAGGARARRGTASRLAPAGARGAARVGGVLELVACVSPARRTRQRRATPVFR